jgi:hypothetical protein
MKIKERALLLSHTLPAVSTILPSTPRALYSVVSHRPRLGLVPVPIFVLFAPITFVVIVVDFIIFV